MSQFKKRYRVEKANFEELHSALDLRTKCSGSHLAEQIDSRLELLAFLRYLATASFMEVAGDLTGMSKASVFRAVHRCMKAVANLSSKYINFDHDLRRIQRGFESLHGFPFVIGAIDGMHVPIQSVSTLRAELFRNRKGRFSVNVQAGCDSRKLFLDVIARWAGSTHDS